ncbi:hypothetical protein C7T35_21595 [Variovorax sp. WS11]|uniref:TetR/AcrR family transcriptional regulator n=1 Tax=Variovorax sp. WS11 TaxID=1105204 RepID=UPI000D0DA403|nr:TetR/AcrR family transcriptional regulator [Variovorax sp. WS11]NDZ18922.1 TetR family transcriptional regulator [Variovorax sp. WS11]PSL82433.1 hypothetical protein C7T35_21595 [Variovorax sp. WS11]
MTHPDPMPASMSPTVDLPSAENASPRDRLIQAAMRFFAERGTSVPMTEIAMAAQNRNKSAINYHFDGKEGLIEAVHGEILGFIKASYERLLDELEAGESHGTVYEVGLAITAPFFALYVSGPDGPTAVKALARLAFDSPTRGRGFYQTVLSAEFKRFSALLVALRPDKEEGQLRFHLSHCFMATVTGLAILDRWEEVSVPPDPDLLFELMLSYADYVSGGLGSTEKGRPGFDTKRWRDEMAGGRAS